MNWSYFFKAKILPMTDPFSNMAPGRFPNCTIPPSFAKKKIKLLEKPYERH